MTLLESFNFLNFYINKYLGAWYTIPELEQVLDRGQISYYNDQKPKYATSQLVMEILSPFLATYDFTPSNTVSGYIVIPYNSNYLDMLDCQIQFDISTRIIYYGVPFPNKDERANRLNSQIDPVTVTSPIGEITAPRFIRMYPSSGYTGTVTYLRRPVKPVFVYTVISGRVIVFDEAASTNIEWRTTEANAVLLKALETLGVNLSAQDIAQFAEAKTQQNWLGQNRT